MSSSSSYKEERNNESVYKCLLFVLMYSFLQQTFAEKVRSSIKKELPADKGLSMLAGNVLSKAYLITINCLKPSYFLLFDVLLLYFSSCYPSTPDSDQQGTPPGSANVGALPIEGLNSPLRKSESPG